jgi:hypothetical protein
MTGCVRLPPDARSRIVSLTNDDAELADLQRDIDSGAWAKRYSHLQDLTELDLGYRLVIVSKTTGHHGSLSSAELIAEAQTDGAGTTYRYPFVPLPVVRIQFGPPVG